MAVSFKEAAISWILAHGETATAMYGIPSTAEALHIFSTLGIDFEESETPIFGSVVADRGDTDNGATYVDAISATVVAKGSSRYDSSRTGQVNHAYEFIVSKDDFNSMLLGVVIAGVANNAEGQQDWRERFPEEIARIKEVQARNAERERLIADYRAGRMSEEDARKALAAL